MKLVWDESYSIGNAELDRQHQQWMSFYNRLDEAMNNTEAGNMDESKTEVLASVYEYLDEHFCYEEQYLRSIGYPGLEKHWRVHKNFRNEIYQIYRKHSDGELVLSSEIMDMIKNWFLNHILQMDMDYKPFLDARKKESSGE